MYYTKTLWHTSEWWLMYHTGTLWYIDVLVNDWCEDVLAIHDPSLKPTQIIVAVVDITKTPVFNIGLQAFSKWKKKKSQHYWASFAQVK